MTALREREQIPSAVRHPIPHINMCAGTHTVPESILLQPHLQKYEGIPPLSPRLKSARPRPLNLDVGKETSHKIRSQQRHFKEICPSTKRRREVGVYRVQDNIHRNHINHTNYFPHLLKSQRMQNSGETVCIIQCLTDSKENSIRSCFMFCFKSGEDMKMVPKQQTYEETKFSLSVNLSKSKTTFMTMRIRKSLLFDCTSRGTKPT